jgi:hypothetical protein
VAPNLYTRRYTDLASDVSVIQRTKDYDKDPNCLYVVLFYNLSIGNEEKSKDNYAKLEKVYDPNKGFVKAFDGRVGSLQDVQRSMEKLDESVKQFNNNKVFTN